jgi:hypothetical protein
MRTHESSEDDSGGSSPENPQVMAIQARAGSQHEARRMPVLSMSRRSGKVVGPGPGEKRLVKDWDASAPGASQCEAEPHAKRLLPTPVTLLPPPSPTLGAQRQDGEAYRAISKHDVANLEEASTSQVETPHHGIATPAVPLQPRVHYRTGSENSESRESQLESNGYVFNARLNAGITERDTDVAAMHFDNLFKRRGLHPSPTRQAKPGAREETPRAFTQCDHGIAFYESTPPPRCPTASADSPENLREVICDDGVAMAGKEAVGRRKPMIGTRLGDGYGHKIGGRLIFPFLQLQGQDTPIAHNYDQWSAPNRMLKVGLSEPWTDLPKSQVRKPSVELRRVLSFTPMYAMQRVRRPPPDSRAFEVDIAVDPICAGDVLRKLGQDKGPDHNKDQTSHKNTGIPRARQTPRREGRGGGGGGGVVEASTLEQERQVALLKTSVNLVSTVTLYRKFTRALTDENFRRPQRTRASTLRRQQGKNSQIATTIDTSYW